MVSSSERSLTLQASSIRFELNWGKSMWAADWIWSNNHYCVLFLYYFQKQGGCLRESLKRKKRCEEVKVRKEKWLREEKIDRWMFVSPQYSTLLYLCRPFLYFSGDKMKMHEIKDNRSTSDGSHKFFVANKVIVWTLSAISFSKFQLQTH